MSNLPITLPDGSRQELPHGTKRFEFAVDGGVSDAKVAALRELVASRAPSE